MDNAKWTGNAGADQWTVCVTHNDFLDFLLFHPREQANQSSCLRAHPSMRDQAK
jgi:hypothetical protein